MIYLLIDDMNLSNYPNIFLLVFSVYLFAYSACPFHVSIYLPTGLANHLPDEKQGQ